MHANKNICPQAQKLEIKLRNRTGSECILQLLQNIEINVCIKKAMSYLRIFGVSTS